MGQSLIENLKISRRDFIQTAFAAWVAAGLYGSAFTPGFLDRLFRKNATGEYSREIIDQFDIWAGKVVDRFNTVGKAAGIIPQPTIFEKNPFIPKGNNDCLIPSINPNTYMIFIPGALSEELGKWVREFNQPWMNAFNTLRTGKKREEVEKDTEDFIRSLDIDEMMSAKPPIRQEKHFKDMMRAAANIVIWPWEYATGGRVNGGQVPPEHPDAMAIFIAGYMKWVLQTNPEAQFVLFGHSLGASAAHCLLRLIQGGVYKDLAGHLPYAILYAEALNDKSNELLYNLAKMTGSHDLQVETVGNMSSGQGERFKNTLPLALNGSVPPAIYSGLNPRFLEEEHNTKTICVLSPNDLLSGGVPGAYEVNLDFRSAGSGSIKPSVRIGRVPDPTAFVSVPIVLNNFPNLLSDKYHYPNPVAIKPIFGVEVEHIASF